MTTGHHTVGRCRSYNVALATADKGVATISGVGVSAADGGAAAPHGIAAPAANGRLETADPILAAARNRAIVRAEGDRVAEAASDGGILHLDYIALAAANRRRAAADEVKSSTADDAVVVPDSVGRTRCAATANRAADHGRTDHVAAVAANHVGAGGVLLRVQARQGQCHGNGRYRLAWIEGRKRAAARRTAYRRREPARFARKRIRAKVQHDGEQAVGDRGRG